MQHKHHADGVQNKWDIIATKAVLGVPVLSYLHHVFHGGRPSRELVGALRALFLIWQGCPSIGTLKHKPTSHDSIQKVWTLWPKDTALECGTRDGHLTPAMMGQPKCCMLVMMLLFAWTLACWMSLVRFSSPIPVVTVTQCHSSRQ